MLSVVISCEHGGNRVPRAYAAHFRGARRVLGTHRAYDIGALSCARRLARVLRAPLFYSTVTRLLVDLNRSPGHRDLLSCYTRNLDPAQRQRLLARYYQPYRDQIAAAVAARVAAGGRVLHLSVHSFTPVWRRHRRRADLGILYDPQRPRERAVSQAIQAGLRQRAPRWRVRRNYPYRGTADGLTRALRQRFPDPVYAGLELEFNQHLLVHRPAAGRALRDDVAAVLAALVPAPAQGRAASSTRKQGHECRAFI